MSELLLRIAGDATVRGLTTHAGLQVFSAYDFINLVCQKTGNYSKQVWKRLIDVGCVRKDEYTMKFTEYHYGIHQYTRVRQAPMMTLRALQRLLVILGGNVVVNLNDKEHPQVPRFSYNFQPPTASSDVPVARLSSRMPVVVMQNPCVNRGDVFVFY